MLTWRTAVLLLVIALAIAVVAPSVRAYMDQQATLTELRAEAEAAQAEVDGLRADVARWDDPAFVVAQARERLAFVFPGETPYRVVDAETVTGPATGSPAAEREPAVAAGAPWYDRLWGSVVEAGGEADAGAAGGAGTDASGSDASGTGEGDAEDEADEPAGAEDEPLTDVDFGG